MCFYLFFYLNDYDLQLMKTLKSASQKLEYHLKQTEMFGNRNVWPPKSMCMYSVNFVGAPFALMNSCNNAEWHGGDQPVAPLRCDGSPGCFSGLHFLRIVPFP